MIQADEAQTEPYVSVSIASESVFRVLERPWRRPGPPRDVNIWYRVSGRASARASRSRCARYGPNSPSQRVRWLRPGRSATDPFPRWFRGLWACPRGAVEPRGHTRAHTRTRVARERVRRDHHRSSQTDLPLGPLVSPCDTVLSLIREDHQADPRVASSRGITVPSRPACRVQERPCRPFCDHFDTPWTTVAVYRGR